MKRESISKKLRFEVFKRDFFSCQYCGNVPPNSVLEVDHIIPVSKGGKNNIENLITSCFDCNRGKGANELNSVPLTTDNKIEILKEKEYQYRLFQKWNKKIETRINNEVSEVENIYSSHFDYIFTDKFKISVKKFIKELGVFEVKNAMEISCNKLINKDYAIKYFCGICWNKINNR